MIADRNSWVLREGRGTVFIVFVAIGGGEFEGVSPRIFSGDLACVPRRWISRVEHGSHRGQVSKGPGYPGWRWVIVVPAANRASCQAPGLENFLMPSGYLSH